MLRAGTRNTSKGTRNWSGGTRRNCNGRRDLTSWGGRDGRTTPRPGGGGLVHARRGVAMAAKGGLLAVHVDVKVKDGCEEAFVKASLHNATNSVQEPGVARFDVIQEADNKKHFTLVEVYNSSDAPAAHKDTAHYLKWRDEVADMMAVPRRNQKFTNLFPASLEGWN